MWLMAADIHQNLYLCDYRLRLWHLGCVGHLICASLCVCGLRSWLCGWKIFGTRWEVDLYGFSVC